MNGLFRATRRMFGSGASSSSGAHGAAHGHGGHGSATDLHLHEPATWHKVAGQGFCAVMWAWILIRAKEDGPAVLGLRHPWDHHGGDHHDEEGHH